MISYDHDDLRAREEDLTPRGVVRAVLCAYQETDPVAPRSVLDVCAGYGVWSSEARRLWPDAHITAVEIDARKSEYLARHADQVIVGSDWTNALPVESQGSLEYSLAIGNPHFSGLVTDDPHGSMPARLLEHCGVVLLFHQSASFQRGRAGARIWRTYQPAHVFSVPGAIRFRTGINPATGKRYGTDARCYQATLWIHGYAGPTRFTQLPWIPSADRRWDAHPGTD